MGPFKKKKVRKGEFEEHPNVNGAATNKCSYDMLVICKLILTQILDIKDVSLSVFTNDRLVKKFDTSDVEIQAILQGQPFLKTYVLHLRSNVSSSLLETICHEMVHLSQYYNGRLKLDGTTFYGDGKEYKNTPYGSRPGEIEAREKTPKLVKKVKELYYE